MDIFLKEIMKAHNYRCEIFKSIIINFRKKRINDKRVNNGQTYRRLDRQMNVIIT